MRAKGDQLEQEDAIGFHEAKMDRTAKLMDNAAQNEQDQRAARSAAIAGIGSAAISGAGAIVKGYEADN